ncbi:MAG: hypothetical protein ACE366_01755 [Bradymonadia bacterium]
MSEEKHSTANGAGDGDRWSIERVAAEPEHTRRRAVEAWLAQSPTRTALSTLAEAEVDPEVCEIVRDHLVQQGVRVPWSVVAPFLKGEPCRSPWAVLVEPRAGEPPPLWWLIESAAASRSLPWGWGHFTAGDRWGGLWHVMGAALDQVPSGGLEAKEAHTLKKLRSKLVKWAEQIHDEDDSVDGSWDGSWEAVPDSLGGRSPTVWLALVDDLLGEGPDAT